MEFIHFEVPDQLTAIALACYWGAAFRWNVWANRDEERRHWRVTTPAEHPMWKAINEAFVAGRTV